jgi:thiamine-phosphate diphosphorylase
MKPDLRERLRVMVITDPDCGGRDLVDVVRAALRGGAPAIQLRIKHGAARDMVEMAHALLALTRPAGALLFVNDRVDVAVIAGADGAHIGQDDLPVGAARRVSPPGFLLGVSAESVELAVQAEAEGADYLGVGPVYATGSKADAGEPIGLGRIAEVAASVRIPVVGIGGIGIGNARSVVESGAAGVAVISAVMRADDPESAVRDLLRATTI